MGRPRTYLLDQQYEALLRRDPCPYCGAPSEHLDHIVAVVRGGNDSWENLTGSCGSCNHAKRDRTLLLFLWQRSAPNIEYQSSPRAGVRWRRDVQRWAAYVDVVRRRHLGNYDTAEEAIAAVESWWEQNPDAMSPRIRRSRARSEKIRELWAQGMTIAAIAEQLDTTPKGIENAMRRLRDKGVDLPRVGRGGPNKSRPARRGTKVPGKGYRLDDRYAKPWHVQVQAGGAKLVTRCATEAEAQAAVAAFRARYGRKPRGS